MANQIVNFAFLDAGTGAPQLVTGSTSGSAVSVHLGGNGSSALILADVVYLYAHNNDASADVELLLEVSGDTANPIRQMIAPRAGLTLVLAGLPLGVSVTLKAYASVANKITLYGTVDRIVEQ